MNILKNLTGPQQEAVTHIEGPLLVIAGAGSGKTRVITRRIAYLIEQGIPAHTILAITFTNKAADEMRERVEALTSVRGVFISTFHSFCARMLRRFLPAVGKSDNFSIYDEQDKHKAIRACLKKLELDASNWNPSAIGETISKLKNDLHTPAEFAEAAGSYYEKIVSKVYKAYETFLEANNALDFDDLLMKMVMLIKGNPAIKDKLQEHFRYILIDEYQDTNKVQYELARDLADKYRNICVTGDPDQSIYGWRGAKMKNILRFTDDYPDAKVVRLEQNYRSTKKILAAASEIIAHNQFRWEKELWTENIEGIPVKIVKTGDEEDEARYIAETIKEKMKEGKNRYKDFAVFYRINALSRVIERVFVEENIPYALVGSVAFYQRREVKDIIAYLKALQNPADTVSLKRIINVPSRKIGAKTVEKIENTARHNTTAMLDAVHAMAESKNVSSQIRKKLKPFSELMRVLDVLPPYPVSDIVKNVLALTGYEKQFNPEIPEDQERIANIQELVSAAVEYDAKYPDGSLKDFLENVSLVSDIDKWDDTSDAVACMTLHSAKGLEFPYIFIVATEEGILPHQSALEDDEELEEERRLCYVGITRAQRELSFLHSQTRMCYGVTTVQSMSRFLEEMPAETADFADLTIDNRESYGTIRSQRYAAGEDDSEIRADRTTQKGTASSRRGGAASRRSGRASRQDETVASGDMVYHQSFGYGKVRAVSGRGKRMMVEVAFDSCGVKKLAAQYAKLKKVL